MVSLVKMGNFFTEHRERNGYTQHEVSEFVGVCDKTIQNLEGGKKLTDFNTLTKLCDLYKISLAELDQFYSREYEMTYALEIYENSDKGRNKKPQPV